MSLAPPTSNKNQEWSPPILHLFVAQTLWVSKRPKRVRLLDTPKRSTLMARWQIGHFGPRMRSPSMFQKCFRNLSSRSETVSSKSYLCRCQNITTHTGSLEWSGTRRDVWGKRPTKSYCWAPVEGGCLSHHSQGLIHINAGLDFPQQLSELLNIHTCFIWRPFNLLTWWSMQGNYSHILLIWSSRNTE